MATALETTSKRLPNELMELVDLAVFTFACQSGLRSTDTVQGDPVIVGVCAFLATFFDVPVKKQ